MRVTDHLESDIRALLDDPQFEGHPLRDALGALFQRYSSQLTHLERLTHIADGYQSAARERQQSIEDRYAKQMRQLEKIVRISDHYQVLMRDLNEALKVASTHDPLTGLANRRLMAERLEAEAGLCDRMGQVFAVALIDIDYFKRVNDTFGHDIGDAALVNTARTLTTGLRPYDICARWGGEEFLVLLPDTTGPNAQVIAERVRETVADLVHPEFPSPHSFTVSIGIAEHRPGDSINDTIKRADDALYAAKHAGRNRAVLAE